MNILVSDLPLEEIVAYILAEAQLKLQLNIAQLLREIRLELIEPIWPDNGMRIGDTLDLIPKLSLHIKGSLNFLPFPVFRFCKNVSHFCREHR